MRNVRTYTELSYIPTFEERFKYLQLNGQVGVETFGFDRYMNQKFYKSKEWKAIRQDVILRDNGCDLGIDDLPILGRCYIHHMNPVSLSDLGTSDMSMILDPEYLICVSYNTHNAIHYSNESILVTNKIVTRTPNDMCPWKN